MKRHTVVYLFVALFIGLAMAFFVFGSLPLAAETLPVPIGLTETATLAPTNTPVPVDTNTPVPVNTNTPVPVITNTPVPVMTDTPAPGPTNTSAPAATNTPAPTATNTATAPAIVGFPDTGGNPKMGEIPSWILLLAAAFAISLGLLVSRLTTPTQR